jgi:hypothetical protein
LTEAVRLQAEINKTAKNLERSYDGILKRIRRLKDRLNALEQAVSQNVGPGGTNRVKGLDSVSEGLSRLSDSLIIRSKRAWQTYDKLERKCKAGGYEPTRLDDVRVLCMKTEGTAADLLCYTLGRLRRRSKPPE